jgi:hypothetical protein
MNVIKNKGKHFAIPLKKSLLILIAVKIGFRFSSKFFHLFGKLKIFEITSIVINKGIKIYKSKDFFLFFKFIVKY